MSLGESDLRRGMAVLDQYREQIEALAQQQDIVRISLEEHMRARETLTRYREAGKGAEVLVPVGANSFLVAESKDVNKAFVSIGSDLLVYDDIGQQIERLDARIKSITDAANAIGQRLGEL
ncbi:MAG: prefoldin subunit alpha, partial [Methanobacteriota archaeon]